VFRISCHSASSSIWAASAAGGISLYDANETAEDRSSAWHGSLHAGSFISLGILADRSSQWVDMGDGRLAGGGWGGLSAVPVIRSLKITGLFEPATLH